MSDLGIKETSKQEIKIFVFRLFFEVSASLKLQLEVQEAKK
jgi:hypothetical protein